MSKFLALIGCHIIACQMWSVEVVLYAPRPVDASADGQAVLLTARFAANLGANESLVSPGFSLRGVLTSQRDDRGNLTGRYEVRELWWEAQTVERVASYDAGRGPIIEPDATVAGEVYWYSPDQTLLNRAVVRTGMVFKDQAALLNFRTSEIDEGPSVHRRLRGVDHRSEGWVGTPTLQISSTSRVDGIGVHTVPGAWVVVYTLDGTPYVFQERDLSYQSPDMVDPYMQDGALLQHQPVVMNNQGQLVIPYDRGDGIELRAYANPQMNRGLDALPADLRAKVLPHRGTSVGPPNVLVTDAPERDPEVQNLFDEAAAARRGDSDLARSSTANLGAEVASGGLFTAEGGIVNNGKLDQGTGSAKLDAQWAERPQDDEILNRLQASKNLALTQEELNTATAAGVEEADRTSLREAIMEVEAWMQKQAPATQPLRGRSLYHPAEMHPAGIWPWYLEGNPVPGHGDNPRDPQPSAHKQTGVPAYDLDGDGDLDRYNTSDPWDTGYKWLRIRWDVTKNNFRLSDYNGFSFLFAVSGRTAKGVEDLLFVGRDGALYRSYQHRWTGVTNYTHALKSLLEPTGTPNTYRFALKYTGKTVNAVEPIVYTPVVTSGSGTIEQTVSVNGVPITGPREVWRETAFVYNTLVDDGVIDPQDIATANFSDPGFVPRTTEGKPYGGAKYVRVFTQYEYSNGIFVPGNEITQVVYFPSDFREDQLVNEVMPNLSGDDNSFEWDFTRLGDGRPWNYHRGSHFPRGALWVHLNESRVVQHWGGTPPLMTLQGILTSESQGVNFTVKERPSANPDLVDGMSAEQVAAATADWVTHRAMTHSPYDERTDIRPGRDYNLRKGDRLLEVEQGVGFYIFKGARRDFVSGAQQADLLEEMWEWYTWQPPTTYKVLYVDDDPAKPKLNTVRARTKADGNLGTLRNGELWQEITVAGDDNNYNVQRRAQLCTQNIMLFSAARGREAEIAFALASPPTTKLYCIEYESVEEVEKLFQDSGHELHFIETKEQERRLKGELNERVFGKRHIKARMNDRGAVAKVVNDGAVLTQSQSQNGGYVFSQQDMLYEQPACKLDRVALLDDGQYGDPRTEQWYGEWVVQYRHPMVLLYDDRYSALIVAYGANANPERWVETLKSYGEPVEGEGLKYDPEERKRFEAWSTDERLARIYDELNQDIYQDAVEGNLTLPPPPTEVPLPVQPVPPGAWAGGEFVPPVVVAAPGAEPVPPAAPWAGTPGLDDLPLEEAAERFVGPEPDSNIGIAWTKYVRITRWPTRPPYSPPTYTWSNRGAAALSANGYLAQARNNDYTSGTQYFLGQVTWTGPTTLFHTSYQIDNSASLAMAERAHSPSANATGSTAIFSVSRVASGNGADITLETGKTYYFRLVFTGGGSPNFFYIRASNVAHAGWAARQELANVHLAAMSEYEVIHQAWVDQGRAYQTYLEEKGVYESRQAEYNAWLQQNLVAQEEYQKAMLTYDAKVAAYQAYLEAKRVYDEQVAPLLPLKAKWDAYAEVRDSWVFLVKTEIAEAGVAWHDGDPIFTAFDWWNAHVDY